MPEKTLADMSVEELEKKFNAKAKMGIISASRGKYYVTVDKRKTQLDPNMIVSSQPLEKILKTKMEARVIVGPDRAIIVIIVRPPRIRCYHIICYIPVPELRPVVEKAVRVDLVKRLVKDKSLPAALGNQIIKEINAGL